MRTIATLNLPATTSGICRSALLPSAPVPAHSLAALEPPAAAEPLGAAEFEQAPKTTIAAVRSDNSRRRVVTMDSPPRNARTGSERVGISALGSAIQRQPHGFPAGTVATKDSPGPTTDVALNQWWPGGPRGVPSSQSATIARMFERTV